MHQALLHEGAGFYPGALAKTKEFGGHPGLIKAATFESIVQLSHTIIHCVAQLLNEAVRERHWSGIGKSSPALSPTKRSPIWAKPSSPSESAVP